MRHIPTMRLAALMALFPWGLCAQTPEPAPAPPQEVVEPAGPNYLFMGNAAFEDGAFEEAIAAYSTLPEMGMPPYAHNRLALSYHLTNRLTEAEKLYKLATKRDKELSAAYNNLGALYYGRRKFKDAENRFKDALKYDAENLVLRYNLRAAKYARENGRAIRSMLMEEMTSNPLLVGEPEGDLVRVKFLMPADTLAEVTLLERRGDSFLARKMFEDAIIEYQRALKINKYNPAIANRLGIAYHQSQRLRDAERQYKAALKINKYYLQALNNLGSVEYTRKRYQRAINYYGKALEISPNSPTILQNYGSCLFAMERYERGLAVYIRALQIDPNLFNHTGGFGTLIQTAQRNESLANYYMAKVFAASGDKDRAMSFLFRAVEEGFDNTEMLADPAFAFLAADARFVRLMASLGVKQ